MAEKDGLTELALMFKKNEPKKLPSITTGIVEALPPEPVIRLGNVITLDKTQLIFASNLISGYELVIGDEVIVVPVMDSQMYYALSKAVRFE